MSPQIYMKSCSNCVSGAYGTLVTQAMTAYRMVALRSLLTFPQALLLNTVLRGVTIQWNYV